MEKPFVVYLHSDAFDRIYQAVNMILTAASGGQNCFLFLFYHALGSFVAGEWDNMNISKSAGKRGSGGEEPIWGRTLERAFELANLPSLYELLEQATRQPGPVSVYACSNSVQYLNLDHTEVKRRVDEIVGIATMQHISSGATQVLYL